MIDIVEFTIKRYNQKENANWNLGETIWSGVFAREEADKKRKVVRRMISFIEANECDLYRWEIGDFLKIFRIKNITSFNDMGEEVYCQFIGNCSREQKKKKHLAAKRLCRVLTLKDTEYWFSGCLESVGTGTYGYAMTERGTQVLSISDREQTIKRKITGRKAAITRNMNRAKLVRTEYRKTLFPEEYRKDPRYKRIIKYLPEQRERLREAKKMDAKELESVVGGMDEDAFLSLMRTLLKMKKFEYITRQ